MIKKILFLTLLLILIKGCSSFEFVYNTSENMEYGLKYKTSFSISGDNKDIINSYLLGKFREAESSPIYNLSIVSSSLVEAAVIEVDATASKFIIKHDLKYILYNTRSNCIILEKNIITKNSYFAKSAGYSFGTDLAEKELSIKTLHSNIDRFLGELLINYNDLKCKNED